MTNDNYNPAVQHAQRASKYFPQLFDGFKTCHFLMTININASENRPKPMSSEPAKKILTKFHRNLDRRLFGRKFYRVVSDRRTFFIAMPEHINSNLHYHLLVRLPPIPEHIFLSSAAYELYRRIPSAKLHLTKLGSKKDLRKTRFYSCKTLIQETNFENFLISSEFQSSLKIWREKGSPLFPADGNAQFS